MFNFVRNWMTKGECLDEILEAVELRGALLSRVKRHRPTPDIAIARLQELKRENRSYWLDVSVKKTKQFMNKQGIYFVLVPETFSIPSDAYIIGEMINPNFEQERKAVLSELVKLQLEGKVTPLGNGKYAPLICPACYGDRTINGDECDICDANGWLDFKQYQAICKPVFDTHRLVKETSVEKVEKRAREIMMLQQTMPELLYPSEFNDVILHVIT